MCICIYVYDSMIVYNEPKWTYITRFLASYDLSTQSIHHSLRPCLEIKDPVVGRYRNTQNPLVNSHWLNNGFTSTSGIIMDD